MTYVYVWRNNEKRARLYGRVCRVLARGGMNSALVEFENGQRLMAEAEKHLPKDEFGRVPQKATYLYISQNYWQLTGGE